MISTKASPGIQKGVHSSLGGNSTPNKITQTINIPGVYDFFRVENSQVSVTRNRKNEPGYALVVKTSDNIRPEEMDGAVTAWELPIYRPKDNKKKRATNWSRFQKEITPEVLKNLSPNRIKTSEYWRRLCQNQQFFHEGQSTSLYFCSD